EINACRICRRKAPELWIELARVAGRGGVVLRHRLFRPCLRIAADISHDSVKRDHWRIGADGNVTYILLANLRINWPGEANLALLSMGEHLKLERSVVQRLSSR